ncbi:MAG TPA: glycosyltransferase family 2 protein [Stenomitos sp.]
MLAETISTLLLPVEGILLFNVGFYGLATAGALLAKRFPRTLAVREAPPGRLAVLVSAHDEEAVIGGLIASLMAQEYPRAAFEVFLVADRCGDRTAAIARAGGARVFERQEGTGSKGAALGWLWEQIGPERSAFEAVVILDADNQADPRFLAELDRGRRAGRRVIQGQRVAKNPETSTASALDGLAEAIHHRVVSPGLDWWGLSTTISGSGVCYERELFEELVVSTTTQVEDCEWQLMLHAWGVPIRPMPSAVVYDEKIPDFEAMARQRSRWVQGKLRLFARYLGPMAWGAMNGRPGAMEGAGFLLTMLPRSVLLVGLVLMLALCWLPGMLSWPWWVGALGIMALYLATGLVIEGVRASELRALLHAHRFVRVFLGACGKALGRSHIPWVRTPHGQK